MDRPQYIEYILILRNFFQMNNYPLEIIRIIIMSIYRDIDIGCSPYSSHLFFYDRMHPKLIYVRENYKLDTNCIEKLTSTSFQQLLFEEPVKSIECGTDYSVCLTEKGNVYSWGCNQNGQLGLADNIFKCSPQKVQLSNINIINCGYYHTIAYGNGILYGWGANFYCQLGLGDSHNKNKPTILSHPRKDHILQISCGCYDTVCLDNDYNVIGWGLNKEGQLCTNDYLPCVTPREITFFKENNIKVISVKCGFGHTIFLTSLKEIYVCGLNRDNQLGLSGKSRFCIPQKLDFGNINAIECGEYCSVILTTSNKLYTYGCIKRDSPINIMQKFKNISNIKKIKCGNGYMFTITNDNIYI